jgi:hypothetical protein
LVNTTESRTTGEVHERLRRVPDERSRHEIDLLRVQPDVVGELDQLLHQRRGLVHPADPRERVGQPERAAQERSLAAA